MAKKISQLDVLELISGSEVIPVLINGNNFAVRASSIANLVTNVTLGLDNVDNTRDEDKPISTDVATALSNKASVADFNTLSTLIETKANTVHSHSVSQVTGLQDTLNGYNTSISDITVTVNGHSTRLDNLQAAIDSINIPTSYPISAILGLNNTISEINNTLANKANAVHNHTVNSINDFSDGVNNILAQKSYVTHGVSDW